jgi:hypothetical protein
MKSPIYVTQDSAGSSRWVPLDYKQVPFNVGLGVKLAAGSNLTYTVEHTFDDIQDPDQAIEVFPTDGLTGLTAKEDGNFAFPVRAVRITVSGYTAGDATLMIIQGEQR